MATSDWHLCLVVGRADNTPSELFDKASGQWFVLPHPMVEPRARCGLVSIPATALAQAPPAGAAAAP